MSSLALIDQATLTAAQRLLGGCTVNSFEDIDGDIAAFEGLLQAILFFDEICCVDDFDEKAKRNRIADLQVVTFLEKDVIPREKLWDSARKITQDVGFRIVEGRIDTSDFRSILRQIRTHLDFDFEVRKSSTNLIVRTVADAGGLSPETHASLLSLIAHQVRTERPKSSPVYDAPTFKRGVLGDLDHPLARERDACIDASLGEIAASLNWLTMKTVFYIEAARTYEMEVVLHPIRHAFLAHHILKPYQHSSSTYGAVTQMLREGISGTVHEIAKSSEPLVTELNLPMWCAYLATQIQNPSEFIPRCQHLREERLFVEARRQLAELRELSRDGEFAQYKTSVNRLNRELAGVSARLLAKYGVATPQGIALAPFASLVLKATGHPPLPVSVPRLPIPRAFIGATDTYGFRGILRSVVRDLVSIERLGGLHEIITSKVRTHRRN